ncbi:MAG: hypothetical protein H6Q67_1456 [Firmicutes bacterium]|nr:hypothetical protein [Bacillota bacterium]
MLLYVLCRLDGRWRIAKHGKSLQKNPADYVKENMLITTNQRSFLARIAELCRKRNEIRTDSFFGGLPDGEHSRGGTLYRNGADT